MKLKFTSLILSSLFAMTLMAQETIEGVNSTTHPDLYLFGDGIPNSNWGVPPVNPSMFVNNNDGTYDFALTTNGGYFAIVLADALNCPSDDWDCLNALRYGPSEDGVEITNTTVPISMASGAFRIHEGTYQLRLDRNANTITATSLSAVAEQHLNSWKVYAVEGNIYVESDDTFTIYDSIGRDVTSENGNLKGIYLVRVKNETHKVVLK